MPARGCIFKCLQSLLLLLCVATHLSAQKKQLRVAAASDLQTVMPEIAAAFQADSGHHAELIFGSSGNLFAQIQNGAPFDLFFSADSEFPAKLVQSGRAEPRSAVTYAIGTLVLWLPPGANCDPQAEQWRCLLKPEISKVAIANPAHAPYGRAAVQALQFAHLYEQVRPKLVYGENISQTAQFAQSGNADVAFIALAQALSETLKRDGHWVALPRDSYPFIEQAGVVVRRSRNKPEALRFLEFMRSPEGQSILREFGFESPAK